ncbi:MAG: AMP-binding protein, partial [Gammaproteobacteria bacterium]|nr:AMP-binding protein [Gammaproteobacteria bacterium]
TLLSLIRDLAVELNPGYQSSRPVSLDDSLDRDLGFGSLGRAELIARIERSFGVTLTQNAFVVAETPRDLLRMILSAKGTKVAKPIAEFTPIALGEAEPAPYSATTLIEVLNWHVATHPDRPHIKLHSDEGDGEVITYEQLKQGAQVLAAGLQHFGLQPGEAVTIMLPTGKEYFFSFYGILLAGGIPVPIYPPVRRSQLEDHLRRQRGILDNCLATMMITVPEAKPLAQLLRAQVKSLRVVSTANDLLRTSARHTEPVITADSIAFLQYTSGSTGNPKGVVLTHANLVANIRVDGEAIKASGNDTFVSWLPLYHDMGLIGAWLGSLYFSVLLVIMSPLDFLTRPKRWLWAIHSYRGTLSAAPNFAYEFCLRRIEDSELEGLDLSSWRIAFNGAEPVSPDTLTRFCERFEKYGFRSDAVLPVYGLAECAVGLAFPPLRRGLVIDRIQRDPFMRSGTATPATEADQNTQRFVACGQPLRGHELRIVDSSGREMPERQQGALQFRGPSATSGYYRNAAATQQLFDGDWLNTGDLAYIAGGDLYITGRIKDLIIRAGRNIYPHELEEAVGDLEKIRKGCVAIFGSQDPSSGTERLIVLGETRETQEQSRAELRAEINALITEFVGAPADDVVLAPPGSVLKTSSGKIRRTSCRELYEQDRIGRAHAAVWWQLTRMAFAGLVPMLRSTLTYATTRLYAGYAWSLFGLAAPIVWFALLLIPSAAIRWKVVRATARLLAKAAGIHLSVQGLDRLPPQETACILVSNHASYIDGFVLVAALPRHYNFVAKAELGEQFFAGSLLRRLGTEFVERFDKEKGMLDADRVTSVASRGGSILFFAEGTLTRSPGLLPFQMGAFLAAAEAQVPMVPVAIRGTRSILRSGSWFPRRGKVTVTVGQAVVPDSTTTNKWPSAIKLRDAIRREILRYCGEPDLSHETNTKVRTQSQ